MTYQELINHIRDLGFSDDDEMEEFGELVPNSINRAIHEISMSVPAETPNLGSYVFQLTDADEGLVYIDMTEADDGFLCFADTEMMLQKTGDGFYKRFTAFEVMNENTLIIDADEYKGEFKVLFKKAHTPFTIDSDRTTQVPVSKKYHHLVALLAAYYVWLEDEPSKASQYFNMYKTDLNETLSSIANSSSKLKIRVLPGGI